MSTDRRNFLQRLASGAAAASFASAALPASAAAASAASPAAGAAGHDPYAAAANTERAADLFGHAAFAAAEPWDVSWTEKLTGKHRAVFDTPAVDGGVGVLRSGLWQNQVLEVFKPQPADINSVVVVRHEAIILAMSQAFWDEYSIGKKHKVLDGNDKKTTHNPALISETGGAPASMAALSLDKQMSRGTIVLACGLAFRQIVSEVASKNKLPADQARTRAIAGLMPGIVLQPSGFFATTLAGEHGCVYVRAS